MNSRKAKCTVWVDKFVTGWDGKEAQPSVHPVVSLVDALRQEYDTDAHFVPYRLIGDDGVEYPDCPRLKVESIAHLADYGLRAVLDVIPIDIDHADTHSKKTPAPPQEWRDAMWSLATSVCPTSCVYETRGGLRIVAALPRQMEPAEYQQYAQAFRAFLRTKGLGVDEISAWNQCYRLFDVVRNGDRLTGLRSKVCEPTYLPFESGIETAQEEQRKPFKLPRRIEEGSRHQTLVRYGAQLRWQGLESEAIVEQLRLVNTARCRPPAPDEELLGIAQWAAAQESERETRDREARDRGEDQGDGEEDDDGGDHFELGDHTEIARRIISSLSQGGDASLVADRNEIWRYTNQTPWFVTIPSHLIEQQVHSYSGKNVRTHQPNGAVVMRPLRVNDNTVTGVVKSVHRLLAQPRFFDAAKPGIVLQDCFVTVSKEGVKNIAHHPDQRATVSYDFEWTDEEPEIFYQLLHDYWGHKQDFEDYKRILLEFIGACLCGVATDYQTCIVFRGRGSNGKSSLIRVIVGLFPKDAVTNVNLQQFGSETHRAMLASSRLNVVGELPEKRIKQEAAAALKSLVAGDELVAKWLYKDPFKFKSLAGHIVACNSLPEVEDDSDGFFRRFLLIDFDKAFSPDGSSRNIGEQVLELERQKIVCAALRAVPELMRRGRFVQPKESVDEITAWRNGQDELSQFLEDCTEPCEPVRGNGTDGSTLYTSYVAWAPQNGFPQMPKNRFLNMIDKRRRKFYDNGSGKRMYPVALRK